MKEILIQSFTEAVQDPKVATGVIALGAGAATGTILEWLPVVIGVTASLTTIIFTITLFYFHRKKNKRDEEFHEARMEKYRKRRITDPDPTLKED